MIFSTATDGMQTAQRGCIEVGLAWRLWHRCRPRSRYGEREALPQATVPARAIHGYVADPAGHPATDTRSIVSNMIRFCCCKVGATLSRNPL